MLNNIFSNLHKNNNKYPTKFRNNPYIGYFNHNDSNSLMCTNFKNYILDSYLIKNPFIGYINHSYKSFVNEMNNSMLSSDDNIVIDNLLLDDEDMVLNSVNSSMIMNRDVNDNDNDNNRNMILDAISNDSDLDTISLDDNSINDSIIIDDSISINDENIDINDLVIDNYINISNNQSESSSECDRKKNICLDILISEPESESDSYEFINNFDNGDIGISYESFCKVGEILNMSQ